MKKYLLLILPIFFLPLHSFAYTFSRSITLQSSKVPSDQTNFPMEYAETDGWLATSANGGKIQNTVAQTGGSGLTVPADLIFTSDAACATKLNWEIEKYNSTTGDIVAWIQVPTATHASNAVIYECYDDPSVTTWQGNVTGTWDSNFKAVWHLPDGSSLTVKDSTGVNNGTNNGPTATTGQIDGAANIGGTAPNRIDGPTSDLGVQNSNNTVSAWVNISDTVHEQPEFSEDDSGGTIFRLTTVSSSGDPNFSAKANDGMFHGPTASVGLSPGTWTYVVGTFNTVNGWVIYVNGVSKGTDANTLGFNAGTVAHTQIGNYTNAGYGFPFSGSIDEVRISNSTRSQDWITTEYNNQSATSTFYTVGAETSAGIAGLGELLAQARLIIMGRFIVQ